MNEVNEMKVQWFTRSRLSLTHWQIQLLTLTLTRWSW